MQFRYLFVYLQPKNNIVGHKMEQLQATFDKLLRETSTKFHRYMYNRINWDARMIGLMGPRGVGKTTLVLQHIKEQLPRKDSLYVQAEDFQFPASRILCEHCRFLRGFVQAESLLLKDCYLKTLPFYAHSR